MKVQQFRNSVDHLYRKVNSDYHSCVGSSELRNWVEMTTYLVQEVREMECKRAKADDLEERGECLKAAMQRLEQAQERIQKLQDQESERAAKAKAVTDRLQLAVILH